MPCRRQPRARLQRQRASPRGGPCRRGVIQPGGIRPSVGCSGYWTRSLSMDWRSSVEVHAVLRVLADGFDAVGQNVEGVHDELLRGHCGRWVCFDPLLSRSLTRRHARTRRSAIGGCIEDRSGLGVRLRMRFTKTGRRLTPRCGPTETSRHLPGCLRLRPAFSGSVRVGVAGVTGGNLNVGRVDQAPRRRIDHGRRQLCA